MEGKEIPDRVHGTRTGYGNYGCRCARCTEAQKLYMRAWNRQRRERPSEVTIRRVRTDFDRLRDEVLAELSNLYHKTQSTTPKDDAAE